MHRVIVKGLVRGMEAGGNRAIDDDFHGFDDELVMDTWYFLIALRGVGRTMLMYLREAGSQLLFVVAITILDDNRTGNKRKQGKHTRKSHKINRA